MEAVLEKEKIIPRTLMEVYRGLPEGTRVELIEDTLYMAPAPHFRHQRIIRKLMRLLDDFIETHQIGEVFSSPIDVYLNHDGNAVQPDLLVLLNKSLNKLNDEEGCIDGAPEIIIEALSKGNKNHDLVTKKELYESCGVKEYFIVEPESGLVLHYFLQGNGTYLLMHEHLRKLESPLLGHTFEW